MTRFAYRHYGVSLSFNVPLAGVAAPDDAGGTDVIFDLLAPGTAPCADLSWTMPDPPREFWRAPDERGEFLRLRYTGADASAEFFIDGAGRHVWASWSDHVEHEDAAELFFGPVFSCLLCQRGTTVLHAGVVSVDGRAIAIAGPKGAGKSSTTLALVRRGATLISDDVAVLTEMAGADAVQPGAPQLRMRPDPADALCGSYGSLRPMWSHEELRPAKRYLDVDQADISGSPVPLDAIYLLAPRGAHGSETSIRSLGPADALARLMADRHVSVILRPSDHARDLARLARLVERVPVREVLRPDGLDSLEGTVDALLADAVPA